MAHLLTSVLSLTPYLAGVAQGCAPAMCVRMGLNKGLGAPRGHSREIQSRGPRSARVERPAGGAGAVTRPLAPPARIKPYIHTTTLRMYVLLVFAERSKPQPWLSFSTAFSSTEMHGYAPQEKPRQKSSLRPSSDFDLCGCRLASRGSTAGGRAACLRWVGVVRMAGRIDPKMLCLRTLLSSPALIRATTEGGGGRQQACRATASQPISTAEHLNGGMPCINTLNTRSQVGIAPREMTISRPGLVPGPD